MTLREIAETLRLEVRAGNAGLDREVTGGYVSDMLSDVIGNCSQGQLWITLQVHDNIVAVAALKELAGIVVISGKEISPGALKKAEAEHIPVLAADMPAFELAGRLWELGVGKK